MAKAPFGSSGNEDSRGSNVPVSLDTSPNQTLLLDDLVSPCDYSTTSGSILVTASFVPEPSNAVFRGTVAFPLPSHALHSRFSASRAVMLRSRSRASSVFRNDG